MRKQKTRLLNNIRSLFKNRWMENFFFLFTNGRKKGQLFTRFPANHYQYSEGSIRKVERNRFRYELDLSEFLQWIIFYGIQNEPRKKLYGLVEEGMTIFDVGANIGETTLHFSRLTGKNGKVISLEPDNFSHDKLKKHLQLNNVENVILLKYALGDKKGNAYLQKIANNSGEDFITPEAGNSPVVEIDVITLDDLLEENNLRSADLIKIDVEGYEMKVLRGSIKTLSRFHPVLFLELDDRLLQKQNNSAAEVIHFLNELGYSCYHAETNRKVLAEDDFTNAHFDIICKYRLKRTVAYIISQIDHSVLFHSTAELLKKENNWNLVFILLHSRPSAFEDKIRELGIPAHRIHYSGKKNIYSATLKIRRLLKKIQPDIVHTHLFEAGLAGMAASWFIGIRHRIHTRHDAMIHHNYHPHAVKYDRLTNGFATRVIAISENIRSILIHLEKVSPDKIRTIPHGFDFRKMNTSTPASIEEIKNKYPGLKFGKPVIGCVSRLIEWKGVQYIIPAFHQLLNQWPDAHLIIANASGPYTNSIKKQLKSIPEKNYTLISFEPRITDLFKNMDVFVHVPVDERAEAFGQVYIEAMFAGTPMVATLSGIGSEIIRDQKNAMVVNFCNSDDIAEKINYLLSHQDVAHRISQEAKKNVIERFPIEKMISQLNELYESCD